MGTGHGIQRILEIRRVLFSDPDVQNPLRSLDKGRTLLATSPAVILKFKWTEIILATKPF